MWSEATKRRYNEMREELRLLQTVEEAENRPFFKGSMRESPNSHRTITHKPSTKKRKKKKKTCAWVYVSPRVYMDMKSFSRRKNMPLARVFHEMIEDYAKSIGL